MSRSFSVAARSLNQAALGDDNDVVDRWEAKDSMHGGGSRSNRSGWDSTRGGEDSFMSKGSGGSKVWPMGSMLRSASMKVVEEVVNEKRATRTLLW